MFPFFSLTDDELSRAMCYVYSNIANHDLLNRCKQIEKELQSCIDGEVSPTDHSFYPNNELNNVIDTSCDYLTDPESVK